MRERLLTTVRIKSDAEYQFLSRGSTLFDVEIWTNRSKIVNHHIESLKGECTLYRVVNPAFTPLWAVIDKPYDVYTQNDSTQSVFQDLLNHSDIIEGVASVALLIKWKNSIFLMFYFEIQDGVPSMKCIVMDISLSNIQALLAKDTIPDGNHFIDEQNKEDLMDSLIHQRVSMFSNLSAKRQLQLTLEDRQVKIKNIRHKFRTIITSEVKSKMKNTPKTLQAEVAEICFKAMSFKFKNMINMSKNEELDVADWLNIFLEMLGVKEE